MLQAAPFGLLQGKNWFCGLEISNLTFLFGERKNRQVERQVGQNRQVDQNRQVEPT